jgi:hypothetical protein
VHTFKKAWVLVAAVASLAAAVGVDVADHHPRHDRAVPSSYSDGGCPSPPSTSTTRCAWVSVDQ